MNVDTRITLTFSRAEVVAALKSHFPTNLHVQAIPATGTSKNTTPTLATVGDGVSIVWTPLREV